MPNTPVHTQDALVQAGGQGQLPEQVNARLVDAFTAPDVRKPLRAFEFKTVNFRGAPIFVVATQQKHVGRGAHL